MVERMLRLVRAMEIEEKVLNVGVLLCIVALFLPWVGGQWYGNTQQWSGFGFHTGYIGHAVFLLQLYILAMTLSPIFGGPVIVRKAIRNSIRLSVSVISFVLLLSAFTILLRLTSEVSGAEIRFGIYIALVGSALATLYAFLRYQEQRRNEIRELFHHPDAQQPVKKPAPAAFDEDRPPPPPPPPPMPPEDHQLFSQP